jgi:hypothetical protein
MHGFLKPCVLARGSLLLNALYTMRSEKEAEFTNDLLVWLHYFQPVISKGKGFGEGVCCEGEKTCDPQLMRFRHHGPDVLIVAV